MHGGVSHVDTFDPKPDAPAEIRGEFGTDVEQIAFVHEPVAAAYGIARRRAGELLARELEVIDRLGFTPYFVLVADIVGFARAQGIPSVGRGSGAASIVPSNSAKRPRTVEIIMWRTEKSTLV